LPLIEQVTRAIAIPVFVLVRPRPGDFVYSDDELRSMQADIDGAIGAGASGIVTGALTTSGTVETEAIQNLIDCAGSLPVTFHRAFDVVSSQVDALETLIALNVARVLTSGRGPTALDGARDIDGLVRQGATRIEIVAGGGIRDYNVAALIEHTGVREVHSRFVDAASMRRLVANAREAELRCLGT
jgi:copper homeostasis protein